MLFHTAVEGLWGCLGRRGTVRGGGGGGVCMLEKVSDEGMGAVGGLLGHWNMEL